MVCIVAFVCYFDICLPTIFMYTYTHMYACVFVYVAMYVYISTSALAIIISPHPPTFTSRVFF